MSSVGWRTRMAAAFPIVRWLPAYDRRRLRGDVVAGSIVAALMIPQSLGYARIAGVPVEVGLYAVPLALIAYAVLGSSPQLIVGPASTVAIVSGSLVADIAADNPEDAVKITSALAIAAGLVLIATGLLRIAWVAEFLSKPIVTGFVFGLTLTIVIGELPTLLGIPKPSGDLLGVLVRTLRDIGEFHGPTAIVGASALVLLFGGRKVAPRVPWGLVTVVAAVIVSKLLDLEAEGVQMIGEVPSGLPPFELPIVPRDDLGAVVVGGVSLALVALAEGLAATRLFATRGGYRVETERELIGMGASNVGAGLSGGLGVAGSLSKTASAEQSGSTSQVSGLAAAALVVVVLLAFTWVFTDLPQAVLSAVVVVAVWGLMDLPALRRYREVRNADFVAAAVGIAGVVLFGPLPGLGIAIVTSLLAIIYRSSAPRMEVLGRISDEKAAWGRLRGHTTRRAVAGVLVIRLDAPLFWVNAIAIEDGLLAEVGERPDTHSLVLDLEATSQLDTTSADMLLHLHAELAQIGVQLYLARVIHPVSKVLERSGLLDELGDEHIWHSISQCVRAARRASGTKRKRDKRDKRRGEAPEAVPLDGRMETADTTTTESTGETPAGVGNIGESDVIAELADLDEQEAEEVEVVDDPSDDTTEDLYAGRRAGRKRDHAIGLYLGALRDGQPREACEAHVGDRLTQHSARVPDGIDAFVEYCEAIIAHYPKRYLRVVRSIEDGRYVFLHVFQILNDGEREVVTADFFATDSADRIVEHWDVVVPYVTSKTGQSAIDGSVETSELEWTDENKELVRGLLEEVLMKGGDLGRLGEFVAEDCVDHAVAPAGRLPVAGEPRTKKSERLVRRDIVLLVGQGNFVAALCTARRAGEDYTHADIFRVAYGEVVEHWAHAQTVPSTEDAAADAGGS